MSDNPGDSSGTSGDNSWLEASALNVKIVYGLYIVAFLVGGITGIIGVVVAYINRGSAAEWLQTHYTYQIRTFWIGLLYSLVSLILVFVGIGIVLGFLVAVWIIVRAIKGLQAVSRNEPIANVRTWFI